MIGLAFTHIREAPNAVIGGDAQFGFQWVDKGAKHIEQQGLHAVANHAQNIFIDQGGEHDGAAPFELGGVVDLAHRLMGLVHGVYKRQTHMAGLDFKLRQDGVAKGFSSDASAVRDKKDRGVGHGCFQRGWAQTQAYNLTIIQIYPWQTVSAHPKKHNSAVWDRLHMGHTGLNISPGLAPHRF